MNWEFDFLYALQGIHNPVIDKLMVFASTIGNAGIFWMALTLIFLIPKRYRRMGFQMALSMMIVFIIGNLVLKNLIHRDRPCWIDPSVVLLGKNPTDYSFPSGHSMNGFSASVSILLCNKKLGIPAVILATIIAFSRLYNFVHFPTDVLVGSTLGIVVAIVVNWLFKKKGWKENGHTA